MKDDEFIKLIKWHEIEKEHGILEIIGGVKLYCSYHLNTTTLLIEKNPEEFKNEIKKRITEELLRKVYEDRRREFYVAIQELHKIEPINFIAWHNQIENILKIAKRQ